MEIEFTNIWKLYSLRKKIKLVSAAPGPDLPPVPPLHSDFIKILTMSKRLVSSWNGVIYLVRRPKLVEVQSYLRNNSEVNLRFKVVRRLATKLGIRVIDLHEEIISRHPNPLSLFHSGDPSSPLRGFYPKAELHRLTAEVIAKRLRRDGIMPSLSR